MDQLCIGLLMLIEYLIKDNLIINMSVVDLLMSVVDKQTISQTTLCKLSIPCSQLFTETSQVYCC